ncbi:hypothetical protein COLO4_29975 [Corchorus olitorius]|uniref:Uncharacterized protein n=1 Tax=Corchorus olitorius TaxID=93759 RepID=A0A1R3HC21_9ROSI|nr:hypothetical protein COLO4_29975 [Corchorus olitorius]
MGFLSIGSLDVFSHEMGEDGGFTRRISWRWASSKKQTQGREERGSGIWVEAERHQESVSEERRCLKRREVRV